MTKKKKDLFSEFNLYVKTKINITQISWIDENFSKTGLY